MGRKRLHKKGYFSRSKIKGYLLVVLGIAAILLGACSLNTKTDENQGNQDSDIINYTRISKSNSGKKLYVILKNYHGDYWKTVMKSISLASKEINASIYLGGIDNETNATGQISLMNEAIEEGADGILLAPANSSLLMDTCKEVRQKKIPLVLVDSSINSGEFDACYMTDNMDAGKMAAKEMLKMLYDEGNLPSQVLEVGILLSADTSQAMVNRVSGFLDYWAEHAPMKWKVNKKILLNGGDVKKAEEDAKTLLRENAQMKGILGCNNTSTIGIANILLKEQRTDIAMVGFDMAKETKKVIQNPKYHAVSFLQKQDQMGYLGMLSLDSLARGEKTKQKYFDTGVEKIDLKYLMESKGK